MDTRVDLAWEYARSLLHIPQLLRRLAFRTRTLDQTLQEAMLRGNLRKAFTGLDLLMLGIGIVIGTGVFSLTGQALSEFAGSAVFISYFISGVACMCAAACYAELCMEYPVSGSAFTYVMTTFGELPAFVTMAMLLVEYTLGSAAVARGFSRYLALLCNLRADYFLSESTPINNSQMDYMACGITLLLSAALSFGVKESSGFLTIATLVKIVMLVTIILTGVVGGLMHGGAATFKENFLSDELPPNTGVDGLLLGAAFVFFTYTAFDAVCNAAEEARDISQIPMAVLGTVAISGSLYMCLALALSFMVSPATLNECGTSRGQICTPELCSAAPLDSDTDSCPEQQDFNYQLGFVVGFNNVDLGGMQYFVALTALLGITTSLLVSLFSAARIIMVASRDWLLPPPLARISPRTQTPLIAQASLGTVIAVVALFFSFTSLSAMVSFGTLFAMWMVCNVMLYRRFFPEVKLRFTRHGTVEAELTKALRWVPGARLSQRTRRILVVVHLLAINAISITCAGYFRATLGVHNSASPPPSSSIDREVKLKSHDDTELIVSGALALAWVAVTASMALCCPLEYEPRGWRISRWLLPWLPSFAILLISFSAASLNQRVFRVMGAYLGGTLVFYVLYALPMSYIKHFKLDAETSDQLNVVELVYVDGGGWKPSASIFSPAPSHVFSSDSSAASSMQRTSSGASKPGYKVAGGSDGGMSDGSGDGRAAGVAGAGTQFRAAAARPPARLVTLPSLEEEGEERE